MPFEGLDVNHVIYYLETDRSLKYAGLYPACHRTACCRGLVADREQVMVQKSFIIGALLTYITRVYSVCSQILHADSEKSSFSQGW
jgi:hypothetical protein